MRHVIPERYPFPLGTITQEDTGVLFQEILLLICLLQHVIQSTRPQMWEEVWARFSQNLKTSPSMMRLPGSQAIVVCNTVGDLSTMATYWISKLKEQ